MYYNKNPKTEKIGRGLLGDLAAFLKRSGFKDIEFFPSDNVALSATHPDWGEKKFLVIGKRDKGYSFTVFRSKEFRLVKKWRLNRIKRGLDPENISTPEEQDEFWGRSEIYK